MANKKETQVGTQKKGAKGRKIFRKIMFFIFAFIALLVIAAIAIPYFFKDELMERAKIEMNKQIDAKADFSDVHISIFKNFPQVTIGLDDVSIVGKDTFENVRLAQIDKLDATTNIMSIIRPKEGEPIAVKSINLVNPKLNIVILKDGTANYDIVPTQEETTTSTEPAQFKLQLSKYSIENGDIIYDDRQGNTYVKANSLYHTGKGDFTASIYDLATQTKIKALTVSLGDIAYLNKVKLDADIEVNANMNDNKFTLKNNNIQLNALEVNADGWVQTQGEDINLDLDINAPHTAFKEILSLIPGAYTANFKEVQAGGTFALTGKVKGTYNEKNLPAFQLDMNVANGSFQYPSMPLGAKDIQTQIKVNSPSSDMDAMTVQIPQLHLFLGNNPFDAKLNLATPISDPKVDAVVKGIIDLADISKAIPMEGVESMKGKITADVQLNTRKSYIDNKQYDKVDMAGKLALANLDYAMEGMPHLIVRNAQMDFTPQNVKLNEFNAKLGKSDIQASGTLDNILTYFSPGETMKGKLKVRSQYLNVNEFTQTSSNNQKTAQQTEKTPSESPVFDKFEFDLDAQFGEIIYEDYHLKNAVAVGHFSPTRLTFSQLKTNIGKSDVDMKGDLKNVFAYLYENGTLTGDLTLRSNTLDANELMGTTPQTTSTTPNTKTETQGKTDFGKFNVNLDAKIGRLEYEEYKLNNAVAKGKFTDKTLKVSQLATQIGKSDIAIQGQLNNAIDYVFNDGKLTGKIDFQSKNLDLNELMDSPVTTSTNNAKTSTPSTTERTDFGQFDVDLNATINQLAYEDYKLRNAVAKGKFTPEQLEFSKLNTKIGKSDIAMKGQLNNAIDYVFNNEAIDGKIALYSNKLDLNELMGIEPAATNNSNARTETATSATESVVLVPELMDIKIDANIKELIYSNLDLTQLKGRVNVKEEKLSLENVTTNLLGGNIQLVGGYDTKDKTKPKFDLSYAIEQFNFQKTYKTFNTFEKAAPLAQFIQGIFNSNLKMSGIMNQDMTPNLNTISANGDLFTLDALIKGYPPLKELSSKLNLQYLSDDIRIKNTKNWFKIKDGKVQIDEFPFSYKGIKARIGGSHGFDNNIDYVLKLHVPMKMIGKGGVAGYTESGIGFLNKYASKAGINLNQLRLGEMIQIDVLLQGQMTKPKIKILKVAMSDEKSEDIKDVVIDQVKDEVKDKINEGKEIVKDKAEEIIDKAATETEVIIDKAEEVVKDKTEEVVDKVEEQVKDRISDKAEEVLNDKTQEVKDKIGKEVGDKVEEVLGDKKDKVKDAVKDKINKWNPFKKND